MKVHEFKHEMTQTSAIFGRQSDLQVVFQGDSAATDGKTIYLPALPEDMELSDDLVRAMRGYVDHEAGHHRHTNLPLTFSEWDKWKKNGHESLGILHNQVEDIWMEEQVIDDYVGAEKNLRGTDELVSKKELPLIKKEIEEGTFFGGKLTIDEAMVAIGKIGREHRGSTTAQEIIDLIPEKLQEHAREWKKHILAAKNTSDCIKISKAIYDLIERDPNLESKPEDFDPDQPSNAGEASDGEPTPEQVSSQVGKGEGPPTKMKVQLGEGEGEGEGVTAAGDMADAIKGGIPSGAIGEPNGDYKGSYRILTTAEDKVIPPEKIANRSGLENYNKSRSKVTGVVNVIRARLRRALLSKQRRDWDGGRELGKLDSKRLVAAYQRSPTVFKQRVDRKEEDTAVMVLVDLSGSMGHRGRPKIDTAEEVAIALAECFEGTALRYSIVGFDAASLHRHYEESGNYHRLDANVMYNFKPWETPLRAARAALGSLADTGKKNNADRDAILWCINQLKDRPEKRKVLLVLSDGHPAHETHADGEELVKHVKKAVEYGVSKGVQCVGIGILDSSVKKIYPDAVVVNRVEDLATTVFKKFTDILLREVK